MATLAADKERIVEKIPTDFNDLPVIAADIIYEGSAVGNDGNGNMRPLVAGDAFEGFASAKVDNSTGAAGDKRVRVIKKGAVKLAVASLVLGDLGKPVYASDDDTFVLTEGSNSYIGRVIRFDAAGVGMVSFDADNPPGAEIGALTDSTGGTADGTLSAIPAGGTGAAAGGWDTAGNRDTAIVNINNNFAELSAKVNALERMVRGI